MVTSQRVLRLVIAGALAGGCSLPHATLREGGAPSDGVSPDRGEASIPADDVSDVTIIEDREEPDAADVITTMDASDAGADVALDVPVDVALDVPADVARDVATDVSPDVSCGAGLTRCGASCVNTATSLAHCGACDRACPTVMNGAPTCNSGTCGLVCNPGFRAVTMAGTTTCAADVTADADACPGQALALTENGTTNVVGTTAGRRSLRTGMGNPCDRLSGPEAYFRVTAPSAGTLRVDLTSFEALGVYVLADTCVMGMAGTQRVCSYRAAGMGPRGRIDSITLDATAGQVFTIVVDSPTMTGQPFSLTVAHEASCGTNTSGARTCGDGNATGMDGCSPMCSVEMGVLQSTCTGASGMMARPITVGSTPVTIEGSWSGMDMIRACATDHDRGERIVVLDVPTPTSLRLELQPSAGARTAIAVRRSCGNAMGQLCANVVGDTSKGERLDVTTTMMNERLFVILDSDTDMAFTFRVIPRNCGDGLLSANEQCDDGNVAAGDGCDATCAIEAVCAGMESADSTLTAPAVLPDCRSVRWSGRLNPMGGADRDDAARVFLRAGEVVNFQLSSGPQGNCAPGADPIIEVSRGMTAAVPATRNIECVNDVPSICVDDSLTYCPDGRFVAPVDDWYTFRMYRYQDLGGAFDYQLLLTRR
jgi:cysteine-rich repeat protein